MSEKQKKSGKKKVGKKGYSLSRTTSGKISTPPLPQEENSDANLYKSGIWGLDLTAVKLPPKAGKAPAFQMAKERNKDLSHHQHKLAHKEETFKDLVKTYKKANKTVEKAKKTWKKIKKREERPEDKMMAKLRLQIAKHEKRAVKEEMDRILDNTI
jgi:hypothetical protein